MDFLDVATRRDVDAATPPQLVHLIGELAPIAREADGVQGREWIHDRDEIGRAERPEDDTRQIVTRTNGTSKLTDVIVVPEYEEHSHIVFGGFDRGMLGAADRQQLFIRDLSGRLDQLEGGDRLELLVVAHLEIVGGERRHGVAAAVDDGHVDANDVRARELRRRVRLLPRLLPAGSWPRRDRQDRGRDCGRGRASEAAPMER